MNNTFLPPPTKQDGMYREEAANYNQMRVNRASAGHAVKWSKFVRNKQGHDGLFLVQMRDGQIHLGQFYSGAFVQDGFCFNNTPGLIADIKFIQSVKPPSKKFDAGGHPD